MTAEQHRALALLAASPEGLRNGRGGSLALHIGHGMPGAPHVHGLDVAPLSHGRSSCASQTQLVESQRSHGMTVVIAISLLRERTC